MLTSEFFRVASSGKTVDGREITPEHIDQMAASYNPKTYGARIWLEHFRSWLPDSPFKSYGDVIALRAEDGDGDLEGRRILLAQISPTPDLVALNRAGQKVYTSVEIHTDFPDTGEAYLMGLAVTDSPASLGTDLLKFCLNKKSEFSRGSELPDSLFSENMESGPLEFTGEEERKKSGEDNNWFSRVTDLLGVSDKRNEREFSNLQGAMLEMAGALSGLQSELDRLPGPNDLQDLKKQVAAFNGKIRRLEKLSEEPAPGHRNRPGADGSGGSPVTDC